MCKGCVNYSLLTNIAGKRKIVLYLQKCFETLQQQCRIQKFSLELYPEPRFWGEESLFLFSENQNCLTVIAMMNSKFLPGTKPRTFFLWKRKFFIFFLQKCTKTLLQQCRIQKFPRGHYYGPRFRGKESLFLLSENVPKLSYSNAEFKKIPGDNTPDPLFWGEESLFSFSENQNCPTVIEMQNSKIFPGTKLRTFVSGKRKVCFRFSKMY